ncbi:hypothetical protein AVEN_2565-1 [Araneus ventricosus]|uniref:Uncharacterized protein n=1 Tax=Araneus ventricosus TaxID=182803 RepID=A0A4Y2GRS6_ARAVE|nr:hypothetical protein AVEN_2565-1 [Araneus ventricosus]
MTKRNIPQQNRNQTQAQKIAQEPFNLPSLNEAKELLHTLQEIKKILQEFSNIIEAYQTSKVSARKITQDKPFAFSCSPIGRLAEPFIDPPSHLPETLSLGNSDISQTPAQLRSRHTISTVVQGKVAASASRLPGTKFSCLIGRDFELVRKDWHLRGSRAAFLVTLKP